MIEESSIPQSKSLLRKVADVLAIILHPLFLSFYGFVVFLSEDLGKGQANAITLLCIAFVLTIVIPLSATLWIGKDIYLKKRSSRPIPLAITFAGYLALILINRFYFSDSYRELKLYEHIVALNVALMFIVTIWYKISVHANGFGVWVAMFSLLAMITASFGESTATLFSIAGLFLLLFLLVMWQRRVSDSHTWPQIAWGFLSGLALSFAYIGFLAEIF